MPDFHFTWPYGHEDDLERGIDRIKSQVGPGWSDLLKRLVIDLIALGWDGEIHQVKEKFGGLRFYTGGLTEEMDARVRQAEEEASKACEACGAPGLIRSNGGWMMCRCDGCWKKVEE